MHRHWTDDELIAQAYGVGPERPELETCPECRLRRARLAAVRRQVVAAPAVSDDELERQRARIWARIDAPSEPRRLGRLTPALAAGCLLLLALVLQSPAPKPALSESDAELLADVYSLASSPEAGAVAPLRGLFEGAPR